MTCTPSPTTSPTHAAPQVGFVIGPMIVPDGKAGARNLNWMLLAEAAVATSIFVAMLVYVIALCAVLSARIIAVAQPLEHHHHRTRQVHTTTITIVLVHT